MMQQKWTNQIFNKEWMTSVCFLFQFYHLFPMMHPITALSSWFMKHFIVLTIMVLTETLFDGEGGGGGGDIMTRKRKQWILSGYHCQQISSSFSFSSHHILHKTQISHFPTKIEMKQKHFFFFVSRPTGVAWRGQPLPKCVSFFRKKFLYFLFLIKHRQSKLKLKWSTSRRYVSFVYS